MLVEQNPEWGVEYERAATVLRVTLGSVVRELYHIGSTAIPGIVAKPIIDILGGVTNVDELDRLTETMNAIGYEARGEFGIPGRRFFTKHNEAGERTHHLHAFDVGSNEIAIHLDFRDYMRAYPHYAQQYESLKQALVAQYSMDRDKYTEGKSEFIREMNAKAALWRQTGE
ncbi:MAG: GrpB family protein [Candidatus Kapabacteria bacterium]|nr:GrpB family protein [Candidatus Kapabacteria bacterium]